MTHFKKIFVLAVVAVIAVASIGYGYAVNYKGAVNSEDNYNVVGVYALHIHEAGSEVLTPLQLDQLSFSEGVSSSGHKCVNIDDSAVSTPQYTLITDETDAAFGAHIRMWMFFENPMIWAFVDHIDLTIWEGEGVPKSYRCGIDNTPTTATSGVCTGLIELTPGVLQHEFIITLTMKATVEIDYLDFGQMVLDPNLMATFVYDDVDPIGPGGDHEH